MAEELIFAKHGNESLDGRDLKQTFINIASKDLERIGPEFSKKWIEALTAAAFATAEKADTKIVGVVVKLILADKE